MHRIAEGFELPNDWGCFTNVGMTLDVSAPLFGFGSAKYDAANVEYATAPILSKWASYYVWTGKHFLMENPASATPNWLFGWRSEGTPGNIVEGGCVGVKNSKFCFALGGPSPVIRATGRNLILPAKIYHIQVELWFAQQFGWVKIKLNNRVIPDLVFNGITAQVGEEFLSQIWIGSLYGGGNGNCWIDDFVLNDQQQFQNQDRGYPGMTIIHSVPSNGDSVYSQFDVYAGNKVWAIQLAEPIVDQAEGVSETPISCTNQQTADVGCVIGVAGPITNPVFENVTSGETISVTGVVPEGSRLVVNTGTHNVYLITPDVDPQNVIIDDWNALVGPSPDWFFLAPGVNSIDVQGAAGNAVLVGWVSYEVGPIDSFTFAAKPAAPTAPIGSAGLVSVDHLYRMKIQGTEVSLDDKLIPGMRRSSTDKFATDIKGHLFPTAILAAHIDRMRKDRITNTEWNPANVDATAAIFQYSNYSEATAQAAINQENYTVGTGTPEAPPPPPPVPPPTPVVIEPEPTPTPQPYPPPSVPPPTVTYEGFGASTIGGEGRTPYHVVNLNPSGTGSLYEAVQASNRYIVFDVAGNVSLPAGLRIRGSNLTIDGFTAPSPGITVTSNGVRFDGRDFGAHDIIIRGIRVRLEDATVEDRNGFLVQYGTNVYNIVVDHCCFSGGTDENIGLVLDVHDITFSWNIFGGGQSEYPPYLGNSTITSGGFSKNFLMHARSKRISVHHNLFVAATDRNPWCKYGGDGANITAPECCLDLRNNYILIQYGGFGTKVSGGSKVNVVNNYYGTTVNGGIDRALIICPPPFPNPITNTALCNAPPGDTPDSQVYVSGNITATAPAVSIQAWNNQAGPFSAPPVTITDAITAARQVYDTAGVRPLDAKDLFLFAYFPRP
jgi:pectate lyase